MTYLFIEQQKQLIIVYTIQQHVTNFKVFRRGEIHLDKVSTIDQFELKAGDFSTFGVTWKYVKHLKYLHLPIQEIVRLDLD